MAQPQRKKSASKANKVAQFSWEGTDRKGNKTKGILSGPNMSMVKAQLRKQGINPTRVRKKSNLFGGEKKKKISSLDIAVFTRQLATMMKAGVPLVQAFGIVADGLENPSMTTLVNDLKAEVESGSTLSASLRKFPKYFDDLFCSLVASGEQSGALENMLDRIALYKEKTEELKSKVKKAIKYPLIIVAVAVVVTGILLVYVVPMFQELFEGFGAELPAFTQLVINLSEAIQSKWYIFIAFIIATVIAFKQAHFRSEKFRNTLDRIALKLPIFGIIINEAAVARFSRTLSTTFAAGVPLVEALVSVADATGNSVYKNAVLKVRDDVASGQKLQFSLKTTNIFPPMAVQMVGIGEESGALDAMLDKVANYFEMEVDNKVEGLTSLMEPFIICVLGVILGGLITAMYLPIFQLGSVV